MNEIKVRDSYSYSEVLQLLAESEKDNTNRLIQKMNKELISNKIITCPCCRGTVGYYKRRINNAQVLFLIELYLLYKITQEPWHFYGRVKDLVKKKHGKNCSDYSKLKDWDLIKSKGELDDDEKSTGMFAITKKGAMWLDGRITVPKYITSTSKGIVLNKSTEQGSIEDYQDDFSLIELYNETLKEEI